MSLVAPLLGDDPLPKEEPRGTELWEQGLVYVLGTTLWWLLYWGLAAVLNDPRGPYARLGGEELLYGQIFEEEHPWVGVVYNVTWITGVTGFWVGHVTMMIKLRNHLDRRIHKRILWWFLAWIVQQTVQILLDFIYKVYTTKGSSEESICYVLYCLSSFIGVVCQCLWFYYSAKVVIDPLKFGGIDVQKAKFGLMWRGVGFLGTLAFLGCTGYDGVVQPLTLGKPINLPQSE